MKNYFKDLINIFYRYYGYEIVNLEDNNSRMTFWGIRKNFEDSIKYVFFCRYDDFNILKETFMKSSYNVYYDKKVELYKVADFKGHYDGNIKLYEDNMAAVNSDSNEIYYSSFRDAVFNDLAYAMGELQKRNKSREESYFKFFSVTNVLILINVVMFVITALLSKNIFVSDDNVLRILGSKNNALIREGQYYRFLTCMFLHGGLVHIACNMYSLYVVGPLVEKVYGRFKFILIYFISGITGSIFSFIFSPYDSIGASAAIFGLLGALLIFSIKIKKTAGKSFFMNIIAVIFLNVFMGITMPGIDNFAHMGGLLSGSILSLALWGNRKS